MLAMQHFPRNINASPLYMPAKPISASSNARTARRERQAAARRPSLPAASPPWLGGGGGSSNRVFSAIIRWNPIPTPSMTASKIAHPIAPLRIARGPPRTANAPPVKNPAIMAFQGSSFFRTPLTAQSNVLNMPPHTPKLPPSTGARALIAVIAIIHPSVSSSRVDLEVIRVITSYSSLAVRTIPKSFHTMPYCSSYTLRIDCQLPSYGEFIC